MKSSCNQQIILGDCLEIMSSMESNSISAIVTDPPYGIKFLGKDWDYGIPGCLFWKEAFRICKPGAWLLAFGGTRTYHRLTCAIEDSGWEIRDCIMWIYGSGFPKGKGCLKPGYEPILLARKPSNKMSDSFLNIDACRIPSQERWSQSCQNISKTKWMDANGRTDRIYNSSELGRWPANLILDDESGEILDNQTGILKSGNLKSSDDLSKECNKGIYQHGRNSRNINNFPSSSGGASRFFYCPKVSAKERNGSNHPTMKPIKLMEYLIKLVMINEGTILDPFAGSGSTIIAAKNLSIDIIGIEKNEEYYNIAKSRLLEGKLSS